MNKKLICTLMAGTLLVGTVTGCGSSSEGDSSAKEEPSGVPHRAGHLGPCPEPPAGQGTPGTVKNIPAFPENGKVGMFLPVGCAE